VKSRKVLAIKTSIAGEQLVGLMQRVGTNEKVSQDPLSAPPGFSVGGVCNTSGKGMVRG
jgi:hypothetical protein